MGQTPSFWNFCTSMSRKRQKKLILGLVKIVLIRCRNVNVQEIQRYEPIKIRDSVVRQVRSLVEKYFYCYEWASSGLVGYRDEKYTNCRTSRIFSGQKSFTDIFFAINRNQYPSHSRYNPIWSLDIKRRWPNLMTCSRVEWTFHLLKWWFLSDAANLSRWFHYRTKWADTLSERTEA